MATDSSVNYPDLPAMRTGMRGRCPRCGRGRLFQGLLNVAERCEVCGLDYEFSNAGDGPAVFVTMIVGFIVVALALMLEFSAHPPFWVHMVIWTPVIILLAIGLLRPLKGFLIAQQYRHRAEEGRVDPAG